MIDPKGLVGAKLYALVIFIITYLWSKHPQVKAVGLIGSIANGSHVPWISDLDFVIITEEDPPMKYIRWGSGLILPFYGRDTIHQHVYVFNLTEWEEVAPFHASHPFRCFRYVYGHLNNAKIPTEQWKKLIFFEASWTLNYIAKNFKGQDSYTRFKKLRDLRKLRQWRHFSDRKIQITQDLADRSARKNTPSIDRWNEYFKRKISKG